MFIEVRECNLAAVQRLQSVVCLGRCVGDFDVFGCELVRRGFGISVEMEFDEVRVLDDGVDNVVVISSWFGFGKPILNTFG